MNKFLGAVLLAVMLVSPVSAYEAGPFYAETATIVGTGNVDIACGGGGRVECFVTVISGAVTVTALRGGVQVYPSAASGDTVIDVAAGETMPLMGRFDTLNIISVDGGGSDVKMVSYQ
jgi:hypothetical protein